ncbi:MAG TPA: hypothetical protein VK911_12195 [Vicinamibacterales bacterium]|nr:hypothetical protein [Vicinamibacterales bacterium]
MMTRYACAVLVVVAALLSAPLGAAENPTGMWVGTTSVPDQGTDQVTLTINKVKDGYAGTMTDTLGMVAKEALRDVQYADGVLTFSFSLTDGVGMSMKLKVAGDKMAGEWLHPGGDAGSITLERKKA